MSDILDAETYSNIIIRMCEAKGGEAALLLNYLQYKLKTLCIRYHKALISTPNTLNAFFPQKSLLYKLLRTVKCKFIYIFFNKRLLHDQIIVWTLISVKKKKVRLN